MPDDEFDYDTTTYLDRVEQEVVRLLRSSECLACRCDRHVESALQMLETLVEANADARTIQCQAAAVREAASIARGAEHACGAES